MDIGFLTSEPLFLIATIVIVIFLVIGALKKVMWMWAVAAILAVAIFVTQPTQVEFVKDTIAELFGGAIDPLSDDTYEDEARELEGEIDMKDELGYITPREETNTISD